MTTLQQNPPMHADETGHEAWPDADGQPTDRKRLPGWLSLVLRLSATAALMAFALRNVEWHKLVGLFSKNDWRWWAAGLVVGLLVQVVGAIRWAALARPIGFPYSLGLFVWRFFEGMFFSLCLPTTIGGDVVKAYRLADSTHGRLLAGCTVLADRLMGLTALGVLAGAAAIGKEASLGTPLTCAVGAGLLAAAIAVVWLGVGSLDRLLSLFPEPHAARQFISRLLPYQLRPSLMVQALGWSLVVQAGGSIAVALIARGIGVDLPLSIWFAVVPLIALAMVLPISISGVGVREGGLAMLLAPSGVSSEQAVAIGLLWFLTTILSGLVGGALFMLDRNPTHGAPPAA
jgi:uncharacterized membrane protein YbhN (UPF0104 family)